MDQTDMLSAAVGRIMDYPKTSANCYDKNACCGNGCKHTQENKPLYFCPHCLYVGHDYGFTTRDIRNNKVIGHTCPNDCRDDSSDDNPIELLEYDYEDDSVPNASKEEHDDALAIFHEFLGKDKV